MNASINSKAIDFNKRTPSANEQPKVTPIERIRLLNRIKKLLRREDAVLVAHYYTDADLQMLAEETGGHVSDSLDMARFGHDHSAQTLVVAGVRFMGETAKILNPEKRVLMPDLNADCSLDMGCPIDKFSHFCDKFPDRKVVVYANTSAAVKARSDWVVTSGIALRVIKHLMQQGEKLIWAPDKYLGSYIQKETNADMKLWDGACIVHEEFNVLRLKSLLKKHPNAALLVHPESPAGIIDLADEVGSTTALISAACNRKEKTLIIATDQGIFYKMKQAAPNKELIIAPTAGVGATCVSCAHCPWMKMNGLRNLAQVLDTGENQIHVNESIRQKALIPLQRMLNFAKQSNINVLATGNA